MWCVRYLDSRVGILNWTTRWMDGKDRRILLPHITHTLNPSERFLSYSYSYSYSVFLPISTSSSRSISSTPMKPWPMTDDPMTLYHDSILLLYCSHLSSFFQKKTQKPHSNLFFFYSHEPFFFFPNAARWSPYPFFVFCFLGLAFS